MAPDKLRPGSAAAVALWNVNKTKIVEWSDALDTYDNCLELVTKAQSKAQLNLSKQTFVEDDNWRENELPKIIETQKHMTLKQLERLMIWKLRRGMFRPTLMGLIRRNDNKVVIDITKSAFEAARLDTGEGLDTLCKLQGVGPATASAILAVYLPSEVPFMSDEAMDAVLGLPRSYTKPQFLQFQKAVSNKANKLGAMWSPALIEKALWSASMLSKFKSSD